MDSAPPRNTWLAPGFVVALRWLFGGSVLRSLCRVYAYYMALGGFTHTSFRPSTPGATLALASPQHPKWNQPRKGARDAARHSRSRSQNSLNAETQRSSARPSRNLEAKPVLTQRRRGTRRNAEKKTSLRLSANLCASALNPSQPASKSGYSGTEGRREGRKKRLFSSAFLRALCVDSSQPVSKSGY